MVIHDFDLRRAIRCPNEAHPELIIDAVDSTLAISRQRLEAIAGRGPQVGKIARGAEVTQFPARHFHQVGRKALRSFAVKDGFSDLIPKAPDHTQSVSLNDTGVKINVSTTDTMIGDLSRQAMVEQSAETAPKKRTLRLHRRMADCAPRKPEGNCISYHIMILADQ